jgi:hypothetical protein
MSDSNTFMIPVSNGIFAHRKRIGASIWVFLWLIDRSTSEVPTKDGKDVEGLVLGGKPIAATQLGKEIGETPRAVRGHLENLSKHGYVRRIEHGPGVAFGYAVRKSKKFKSSRPVLLPTPTVRTSDPLTKKGKTPDVKTSDPLRFSAAHNNKEIPYKDNTGTNTGEPNPKECAVAVSKEHGITSKATIAAIERQIILELALGTGSAWEVACQINRSLRQFSESRHKLEYAWGFQNFLEDGHWRNPERWPWKDDQVLQSMPDYLGLSLSEKRRLAEGLQ